VSGTTPFLIESHSPATFNSRGVAVPFTTPMLAGTRVRESAKTGIELVVPNPSGGRGVYILDWAGVRALGNPTVHDTALSRRMGAIHKLNPAAMRKAALDVALQGHAGRDAAAAARQSMSRDAAHRLHAHFLLMMGLIEQVSPLGEKPTAAEDAERRGSAILHRLAPMLGRAPAELADALAAMGAMFAPTGVGLEDDETRIARLLARLEEAHIALKAWLRADQENDIGGLGRALAGAMQTAAGYGSTILTTTRAGLADPISLLKRWFKDPQDVEALAERADWVLDGWEWVCLLWLSAGSDDARRRALVEMAQLVPVLPAEASGWTNLPPPPETLRQPCRVTSREDSWRTGSAAFSLIGRNETLRAMSI
jgi:hypothetical protein